MSRLRDIFNWFISLGKPSWTESMREEEEEARRQWYLSIPRDQLNDALKCMANQISKNDFDSRRSLISLSDCFQCRYQVFCHSIDRSISKALKQFTKRERANQGVRLINNLKETTND